MAVVFRDPAAFALGIEIPDELSDDLGDQRLKAFVVAVFLGVKNSVPVDDPAHVSGLVGSEDVGRLGSGAAWRHRNLTWSDGRLARLNAAGYPILSRSDGVE